MNPYGNTRMNSDLQDVPAPPPYSPPNPYNNSHNPSLAVALPSPTVILTGCSYVAVFSQNSPPYRASSGQDGGQSALPLPDCCSPPFLASDPGFSFGPGLPSSLAPGSPPARTPPAASGPSPGPYPAQAAPPSFQVSVIISSPDHRLSPLGPRCSADTCPDLECSVCFSQFNNVFRCPKMLQCRHTFCLECLARINVKSSRPDAIQCPLCRGHTPLPALGLSRLATDPAVLSSLPAAMQRVYSVRFLRSKGKLKVKRPSDGPLWWGQRSLRSMNRSLDVGLPSPTVGGRSDDVGGALLGLTDRPACRAFLLTCVVIMMVVLMSIVVFLLTFKIYINHE